MAKTWKQSNISRGLRFTKKRDLIAKTRETFKISHEKRVIEELQKMLVEEKTAGELKAQKLLNERARLEESIQDLRKL